MIELHLPIPPSVNGSTRNVPGRGRVKGKKLKAWIVQADKAYLLQKRSITPMRGACVVEIQLPASMRGDVSNRIKHAEDYLVSREITGDDKNNWEVRAKRNPELTDHCKIIVRPA